MIKSGNKGYNTEINVVTYCRGGRDSDDRSNFRILLVSSLHSSLFKSLVYR